MATSEEMRLAISAGIREYIAENYPLFVPYSNDESLKGVSEKIISKLEELEK